LQKAVEFNNGLVQTPNQICEAVVNSIEASAETTIASKKGKQKGRKIRFTADETLRELTRKQQQLYAKLYSKNGKEKF
jgi:uncharacterized phage infection (PIP) family protein YhgE